MYKSKISLFIMALIALFMIMSFSFCSPRLQPGEDPYGPEDPDADSEDQYEDDDSYGTATVISAGNSQNHTIYDYNGDDDVDYVVFSATAQTSYKIKLSNIKGFEPEVTLFGTNGTTILKMKSTGSYYNTDYDWYGYDSDHNYSEDEKEAILFTPDTDGSYYVSVKDLYGAHDQGSYTISLYEDFEIGLINNLSAEADSENFQIEVTWGSISNVDGYVLYRTNVAQDLANPTYSDFNLIRTLSKENYIDTDIEPNTEYYYYVTGYKSGEEGNPSNVDSAMFDWETFKPTSELISASEGFSAVIYIELLKAYDNSNIARYEIYRANNTTDDPSTYTHIGNLTETGTLSDTDVTAGTYYYYCVRIIINTTSGESASQYSWFDSGVADN